MCCAISSFPLFFRSAVMPVARKVWFPILVLVPADGCAPLNHPVGVLLPHVAANEP
jgi:hypothetical protein